MFYVTLLSIFTSHLPKINSRISEYSKFFKHLSWHFNIQLTFRTNLALKYSKSYQKTIRVMLEFYQGHGKPHDIRILVFLWTSFIFICTVQNIYAWMICGAILSLINISIIHILYANYIHCICVCDHRCITDNTYNTCSFMRECMYVVYVHMWI